MNYEVCLQHGFILCYHSYFPFGVHSSDNPLGFQKGEKSELESAERKMAGRRKTNKVTKSLFLSTNDNTIRVSLDKRL